MLIYFTAYAGQTLTVTLFDYDTLAEVGSFSGADVTEPTDGQYVIDIGALTGQWRVRVDDDQAELVGFGFASDAFPNVTDYPPWVIPTTAEVASTLATGLAADIANQLALTAIRDQLGTGPLVTDRTVARGTTWRIALPFTLPAGWTKAEFTARAREQDKQAASLLHVRLSNPADPAADGLRILRGEAIADGVGAEINTEGETPVVIVAAAKTADVHPAAYRWDAKVWTGEEIDQDGRGELIVEPDVTRLS